MDERFNDQSSDGWIPGRFVAKTTRLVKQIQKKELALTAMISTSSRFQYTQKLLNQPLSVSIHSNRLR